MFKKIIFVFLFQTLVFSQEINISGLVKDNLNRGIVSASVLILDESNATIAYTYSNDLGFFNLRFTKRNTIYRVVVSSLGYQKRESELLISENNMKLNDIILNEKMETLTEVLIENKPIKKEGDTTTIKIAKFINQTEQTIEDILKKIPGIEVQKDGSIKAHGKYIDKLLVEGDDIFDKNYKLLSKNLDAKVLDAVQILDDFEDNPILKNMVSSNKVAINLKLKKNKKNIWFGNINLGAGVVSENRWKESINLGLLRKKVKLFYFADYNNSGEKATDLMIENINNNNLFGEDRYEKKTKPFYNISSNENNTFSKSQSIFNKALLNSLSFTTKLQSNLTMRGQSFFTNDNQIQDSFLETKYNIDSTPIVFLETNKYNEKKTVAAVEIELKYYPNVKNYFTNSFIYRNNPNTIFSNTIFNNSQINQSSKVKNQSMYNHLYHTFKISKKSILNNYLYFGNDKLVNRNKLLSPFLNDFLSVNNTSVSNQTFDHHLSYFGLKSKIISKHKKINYVLDFNSENNFETVNNDLIINNSNRNEYENRLNLKQNILSIGNSLRYSFSEKINLTTNVNYIYNNFDVYSNKGSVYLFNPQISLNIKDKSLGFFLFSISKNSKLPEINFLTNNFALNNYNGFTKGTTFDKITKNISYLLSHSLLNDEKRFAVNTTISYVDVKSTIGKESEINENFTFSKYMLVNGAKNHSINFNFINYFRSLKLSVKIETNQAFGINPTKVNDDEFVNLKTYSGNYKFSGNSYFSLPVNFDFGLTYNFYKSSFKFINSNNITKDAFFNLNYKISKTCLVEFNSVFYQLNSVNYSFLNTVVNYTPVASKLSYRILLNNITNEDSFAISTLDNYTSSTSSIKLIPRYLLLNIKYRF
ncbi:carboxypeptidase-like regulatory domain-containing protein [Flavobacterium sp.]|uniref:carboxypeptidase-like regulatory domain-containing protein n=1 Tax=Flavobacterium sp. TaxID=239 RepID=UPI00286E3416|nr:carboxypeptidase-like regulatory domain-containing protein [Flavobacterium sp.]